MTIDELRSAQAKIRDDQRERMDEIHASCHEYDRDDYRTWISGISYRRKQNAEVKRIHELIHEFMRDFDHAVLIHERMAELNGEDPSEITRALWPVRTEKPE